MPLIPIQTMTHIPIQSMTHIPIQTMPLAVKFN